MLSALILTAEDADVMKKHKNTHREVFPPQVTES